MQRGRVARLPATCSRAAFLAFLPTALGATGGPPSMIASPRPELTAGPDTPGEGATSSRLGAWEAHWRRNISREAAAGYCQTQMGEEIGWLISPLLDGFYQG